MVHPIAPMARRQLRTNVVLATVMALGLSLAGRPLLALGCLVAHLGLLALFFSRVSHLLRSHADSESKLAAARDQALSTAQALADSQAELIRARDEAITASRL